MLIPSVDTTINTKDTNERYDRLWRWKQEIDQKEGGSRNNFKLIIALLATFSTNICSVPNFRLEPNICKRALL